MPDTITKPKSEAYSTLAKKMSEASAVNGIAAVEMTVPFTSETPTRVMLGPLYRLWGWPRK